jgi:hypothetical protein
MQTSSQTPSTAIPMAFEQFVSLPFVMYSMELCPLQYQIFRR